MKRQEFDILLTQRLDKIKETLISKGKEYASDADVFHNFKAATGISFHDAPEQVAWEYLTKHLQSVKDMLHMVSIDQYSGYPDRQLVHEKLGDSINYLILIETMLIERILDYERETVKKSIY